MSNGKVIKTDIPCNYTVDIARKVYERLNFPQYQTRETVFAVMKVIKETLLSGEAVSIQGVGVLKPTVLKTDFIFYNAVTKEKVKRKPYSMHIRFKENQGIKKEFAEIMGEKLNGTEGISGEGSKG